jgi:hypothetical protein
MDTAGKLTTTQRRMLHQGINQLLVNVVAATYREEGTNIEPVEALYYVIELIQAVLNDCSQ